MRVVPTASALRFVGAPTWEALSGEPATDQVFEDVEHVPHVALGQGADLVVVAPATADLLARAAAGRADDLLTSTLLTARCPVVMAPAMHTEMWEHPATVANVATLRARGVHVIEPASGRLTGRTPGRGACPSRTRSRASRSPSWRTCPAPTLPTRVPGRTAGRCRTSWDGAWWCRRAGRASRSTPCGSSATGRAGVRASSSRAPRRRGARTSRSWRRTCPRTWPRSCALPGRARRRGGGRDDGAAARRGAVGSGDGGRRGHGGGRRGLPSGSRAGREDQEGPGPGARADRARGEPGRARRARPRPAASGQVVVGFAAETGDAHASVLDHGRAKARRKGADLLVVNAVGEGRGSRSTRTT